MSGGVEEIIVGSKLHIAAKLSFELEVNFIGFVSSNVERFGNLITFSGLIFFLPLAP
jgi:hypothetical protein